MCVFEALPAEILQSSGGSNRQAKEGQAEVKEEAGEEKELIDEPRSKQVEK